MLITFGECHFCADMRVWVIVLCLWYHWQWTPLRPVQTPKLAGYKYIWISATEVQETQICIIKWIDGNALCWTWANVVQRVDYLVAWCSTLSYLQSSLQYKIPFLNAHGGCPADNLDAKRWNGNEDRKKPHLMQQRVHTATVEFSLRSHDWLERTF